MMENLKSELGLLQSLDHPHIVHILELLRDDDHYYFVMELIETGDLLKVIKQAYENDWILTQVDVAKFVKQILKALNYMHKNGVIHRDLKLKNVMVDIEDGELVCKLTDFGFSCLLDSDGLASGYCGTLLYMAPEIVKKEPYTSKVDTWALGVLTYAALTSTYPFARDSDKEVRAAIQTKDFDRSVFAKFVGADDIIDFLACCLDKNPGTRYSAEQLLKHRWIQKMTQEDCIPMSKTEMIDVTNNLLKVSKTSEFQSSIIYFLVGFQQNKEEQGRLRRYFNAIDKNQDGFITMDELQTIVGEQFENKFVSHFGREDMDLPALLRSLDQDGDGKISYSEFISGATNKGDLINDEKLRMAFKVLDVDNDDLISSVDLMQRFAQSDIDGMTELKVDENFWRDLISACDTNNDGFISWEEFRTNMNKLLTLQTEVTAYGQLDLLTKSNEEEEEKAAIEAGESEELKSIGDDLLSDLGRKSQDGNAAAAHDDEEDGVLSADLKGSEDAESNGPLSSNGTLSMN